MDQKQFVDEIANRVSVTWRNGGSKTMLGAYWLVMERDYPNLVNDKTLRSAVMRNLSARRKRVCKQKPPLTQKRNSKKRREIRREIAQLLGRPYRVLILEAHNNARQRHDADLNDP